MLAIKISTVITIIAYNQICLQLFTISQVNIDGKDLWEPCKQGDEDAQQMTFEKDVSKHVDIAPIQMTKEEIFEIAKKVRDHSNIT